MSTKALVWWLNHWDLKMVSSLEETVGHEMVNIPVLPGHLKMLLNEIERLAAHSRPAPAILPGQLFTPLTLRGAELPDHLTSLLSPGSIHTLLKTRYTGIWFEPVHLDTILQYPGLVTDGELNKLTLIASVTD